MKKYIRHTCVSKKEGDWIVFSCLECDYVRKYNTKTNTMHVFNSKNDILHSGWHEPISKPITKEKLN